MIKYITTVSLIVICCLLNAQPRETTPRFYEEKGINILEEARDKIKSYNSLIINFTYEETSSQKNNDKSFTGKIYIEGEKYFMTFDEHEYISDGETAWACLKDVGEIHISSVENMDHSMNPIYLLDEFQEHYRAKFIREEIHEGESVYIIDAIPGKPRAIFKYRPVIKADDKMLAYIVAYDRHGGDYTIHFDEFKKNPEISKDKFSFDKKEYPGMDIIDLR